MTRHRPGTAVLAKGRLRTEAILDAATKLLIEEGHAALSTRRVAARAGIRPGHLQYYYPAKQDVVRALLERHLARATHDLAGHAVETAGPPMARLAAAIDAILAAQRNDDSRFFWELWALAARDPAIAEAMQAYYRSYWRIIVDALIETTPALGRPRAERRAALLVALLEGLSLFRSRSGARELPVPLLERELRNLVRTLATTLE